MRFHWKVLAGLVLVAGLASRSSLGRSGEIAKGTKGVLWRGGRGLTETVAAIMEREARAPARPELTEEREPYLRRPAPARQNPLAPAAAQWPPPETGQPASGPAPTRAGQGTLLSPGPQLLLAPPGVNFKAVSLFVPPESRFIPPDTVGDIGPGQILVMTNGRIKMFDKTGVLGGLNVTDATFFASVSDAAGLSDPQVRYDRLSGRWFVTELNTRIPNRILIAVSSGSLITDTSSFTFFAFQHDLVGPTPNSDTGGFADYDSLGVDRFALYIGINEFDSSLTAFLGSSGYVVNKSDLLAGTLTVTAFRQLMPAASGTGLYAPRGVSNDDPAATEGYFIGVDRLVLGQLDLRRVSDPGGTPAISDNILLAVPTTNLPIAQVAKGSGRPLDTIDDRLFAAAIHKNKITGVSTLWTAHDFEVNAGGVAATGGGRNGSRWYEIANLTTTPTLSQAGTLFDPAAAASAPRGFWMPSVAMSGQGHVVLGSSFAGANDFAGVAAAGRQRTDAPGTISTAAPLQPSATTYNRQLTASSQRWGDYSQTSVDPADDQTFWTIQEWCDATDSWGVQVVQLQAPPPATPASAAPASVCAGAASINVAITGTSILGSEFFDPGPDAGGPGYPNHITAAATGGVSAHGITFVDPTHITLSLSTLAATPGAQDITITNPDGQSATGSGILTIIGPSAPAASSNGPLCSGATLQLASATVAGATYAWTGPNGFSSSQQNPSIPNATTAASGTYNVTVTVNGCTSAASIVPAVVMAAPAAVTNLLLGSASPTSLSWDDQGLPAGPGTRYDLVSGPLPDAAGASFPAAVCLQPAGGPGFSDARPGPGAGAGYWYLARGRNSCGLGTFGTSQQDATIAACP